MNRRFWLLATSVTLGVVALGWPLFADSASATNWSDHAGPVLAAATIPIAIALLLDDLIRIEFGARTVAVVTGLAALATVVRMVSPGVAGIEPIWLVLLVAGRALGAAEGFAVAIIAMLASALAMGGIGPWLPYQMSVAGWIALGAGLLPRSQRFEIWILAIYGAFSGFLFGWLMNLWFWPTAVGLSDVIALDYADSPLERMAALTRFTILTSIGWDAPRAIVTAVLVLIAGRRLIASVRRVARTAQPVVALA